MKIAVIIPAAGAGKRFVSQAPAHTATPPKTEFDLAGRPVLLRTIDLFVNRPEVEQLIVAVDPGRLDLFRARWGDKLAFHGVQVVAGGKTERWETVHKALQAVSDACTHVAVHDAVRPLASSRLIDRVFQAGDRYPAVIPAVAVQATLKRVCVDRPPPRQEEDPVDAILGDAGKPAACTMRVIETVNRAGLFEAQTPQLFELNLLRRAYAQISDRQIDLDGVTDDAGLVESMGQTVHVVDGESTNLKITQAQDAELAVAIVTTRQAQETANTAKRRLFSNDD